MDSIKQCNDNLENKPHINEWKNWNLHLNERHRATRIKNTIRIHRKSIKVIQYKEKYNLKSSWKWKMQHSKRKCFSKTILNVESIIHNVFKIKFMI